MEKSNETISNVLRFHILTDQMLMTFEQDEFDGAHRKVLMKYPRIVTFQDGLILLI